MKKASSRGDMEERMKKEPYKNPTKREKKVLREDPDTVKVRLNRLIDIGKNIIWLLIGADALLLGLFIRSIVS